MKRYYPIIIISVLIFFSCNSRTTEKKSDRQPVTNTQVDTSKYVTYLDLNQKQNKQDESFIDFDFIKESYDTIYIDNTLYYIVEGDLLFDEDEFMYYIEDLSKSTESEKLVGIIRDGIIVKISNPNNIRYSIIKNSFSDENEYNLMVDYMHEATKNWSEVCNVNFIHEQNKDSILNSNDNPNELTFVVKKFNANGKFIAKAFFPYYAKNRKKVLIDHSFFTTSFSQSGILRHELGHVIGFRHEHIRSGAPANCPNENTQGIIDLTQYDPKSVMHYFCGGVGTKDLKITEIDSIGASIHYPFE